MNNTPAIIDHDQLRLAVCKVAQSWLDEHSDQKADASHIQRYSMDLWDLRRFAEYVLVEYCEKASGLSADMLKRGYL
jgi:hypothetical protein